MRAFRLILLAALVGSAASAGPITTERQSQFEKAMNVIMASVTPQVSEVQRERLAGTSSKGNLTRGRLSILWVVVTFDPRRTKTMRLPATEHWRPVSSGLGNPVRFLPSTTI